MKKIKNFLFFFFLVPLNHHDHNHDHRNWPFIVIIIFILIKQCVETNRKGTKKKKSSNFDGKINRTI